MAAPPPQDRVAAGLSIDLLDAPAMLRKHLIPGKKPYPGQEFDWESRGQPGFAALIRLKSAYLSSTA